MTQEITLRKTEDHYTMQFEGSDSEYPVPQNAIDTLDSELANELNDAGDSVTFIGEYGGMKHLKSFDVEEFETDSDEEEQDESDSQTDVDSDDDEDDAPVDERFAVGDRVENPSQRQGTEYEVVEVGPTTDAFGNEMMSLVVKRADGRGTTDEIPEREQGNWRKIESSDPIESKYEEIDMLRKERDTTLNDYVAWEVHDHGSGELVDVVNDREEANELAADYEHGSVYGLLEDDERLEEVGGVMEQ